MKITMIALACAVLAPLSATAASVTLYDQDYESPSGFVNGFGSGYDDLSQQQVNDLYANQPPGFTFAQTFTVETMLLTGVEAFGTGYDDPSGIGGNYALGMLSTVQDDRLGLAFGVDISSYDFFNFRLDVSSVGLSGGPGAPFADQNVAPVFRFTLYDNPGGTSGIGGGTILDQAELTGTASALDTLDWTAGQFAFDASGATNGNVILQVDLLSGGYAAFDNFRITASDEAGGGLNVVPLPAGLPLLLGALGALVALSRRRA